MKLRHVAAYVWSDVRAVRTRQEAILGIVSVFTCTMALLVILVFTSGFYTFLQHCFHRARPVIGSVHVMPKNRDLIRTHAFMDLSGSNASVVQNLTWISTLDTTDLQFWKSRTAQFERDEPVVWAIPDEHNHLLATENGVQWVSGSPPRVSNRKALRFEIYLNMAYLERFAGWTEPDIKSVLAGRQASVPLPKEVFVHFAPVKLRADADGEAYFEPGTIALPVGGIFALRESWAPDVVVGFDVAAAYYYQNRQRWHPGFVMQFNDGSGKPLVPIERLDGRSVDEDLMLELPRRHQLIACETLSEEGLTPYRMVSAAIANYREPGVRSSFKAALDEPVPVATLYDSDIPQEFDAGRPTTFIAEMAKRDILLSSQTRISRVSGNVWRVRDRKDELVFEVDCSSPEQMAVRKINNWHVNVPSDTASSALKRVTRIVNFYSLAAKWTVLSLAALMITLLGMGYIHRKSLDIGILKSQGIHPAALGVIYSAQVILLALAGFVLATVAFRGVLGGWLEPYAELTLNELTPTFVSEQPIMSLGSAHVGDCLTLIFIAVAVGSLWPCWLAVTLDPIKDLRTGV